MLSGIIPYSSSHSAKKLNNKFILFLDIIRLYAIIERNMCGRFTLGHPSKIKSRFNTKNSVSDFDASYNISPSQYLPTITRNSPNKITMMRWGMLFGKDSRFGPINIRSETTKDRPYFRKLLLNKRCIVPSDGFYEWKILNLEGKAEKYPFYIYQKDNKLFGFAGLYNRFDDAEGKSYFTFAILTCPPNDAIKTIHNRMPVILQEKDENTWLDNKIEDFETLYYLLKPYPNELKFHPVSKDVNNPKYDNENLINAYCY